MGHGGYIGMYRGIMVQIWGLGFIAFWFRVKGLPDMGTNRDIYRGVRGNQVGEKMEDDMQTVT